MPRAAAFAVLALALFGCASGAVPGAMVPPVAQQSLIAERSALRQAIAVGAIGGGQETSPLWTSQVSNPAFAEALRQSLATHAMLSIGGERFRLEATILNLTQPLAGFDMTVTARVSYRLVRVADAGVAFQTDLTTPFTANFSSSFYAVERLRLANEGAIRENIQQMLAQLVAAETREPALFAGPPRVS